MRKPSGGRRPAAASTNVWPEDRFLAAFAERSTGANGWLGELRAEAAECLAARGFPTRRSEAWKYTNIGSVLRREFSFDLTATSGSANSLDIAGLDAHVAVIENGRYLPSESQLSDLPPGVLVMGLADAAESHTWRVRLHLGQVANPKRCSFVALNTLLGRDGAFVFVPRGTQLEKPVHLVQRITASRDTLVQPRILVVAEEDARVTLVQSTAAADPSSAFTNSVTEVVVGRNAFVARVDIQAGSPDRNEVSSLDVTQQTGSTFSNHSFTLGGAIVRNNINILTDAEQCETYLNGLFLAKGSTHIDNHTFVDHAQPNCFSSELYKGILDDRATGVFNGKVLVRQDAQQINAYQTNKSIVLSDRARMYSKPELEIYADDVKCSHGATTGELDAEAVFYLRTRGLTEKQARALMLVSFAREVVDRVDIEPVRDLVDSMVTERLSA